MSEKEKDGNKGKKSRDSDVTVTQGENWQEQMI